MTFPKPAHGLALAALACVLQAAPLCAQDMPPLPGSLTPPGYSPAQRDNGSSGRDRKGRANRPARAQGDRAQDDRNEDDGDDNPGPYGMSMTALDASGGREPVGTMPLAMWLAAHAYAAYAGGGMGNVVAHYPTSSDSNVAGEVFMGARVRYAGIEANYDALGYYQATINGQPAQIGTAMFSLSMLGFLPLSGNTDLFLRYGRTHWSVSAHTGSTTVQPLWSGTNAMMGAGIEFRFNELLFRIEARRFRRIFQSDSYSYAGISVGGYFF